MTFTHWLTETCHLTDCNITPLPGDASFRRYFRIQHNNQSYIAMDASVEKASCVPFVAIARALRAEGLQAPEILASDLTQGFLLLTDFGDHLYLRELTLQNAEELYKYALDALSVLQRCRNTEGWRVPLFTADFMYQELLRFKEWFLEKYLALQLSEQTNNMLEECFNFLAQSAAKQAQVFMHRDFHSANLMVLPNNEVGILDFQDAFIGPVTYDLVSLLRDCYIAWPEEVVTKLVLYYWEKIALPNVTAEEFLCWFDLMGMQRHMKALLTFSRKYCRDNNANYLQHVPRTLNYVLTVGQRYPECRALVNFLTEVAKEKCVG